VSCDTGVFYDAVAFRADQKNETETSLMSKIALKSIIPILFVRDVPGSAAFFREKLGFEVDGNAIAFVTYD
jgi:hypothetical protein